MTLFYKVLIWGIAGYAYIHTLRYLIYAIGA